MEVGLASSQCGEVGSGQNQEGSRRGGSAWLVHVALTGWLVDLGSTRLVDVGDVGDHERMKFRLKDEISF